MLPHLVRLRLSQAHGDNTTAFAPCQEVFYQFSENSENSVLEICSNFKLSLPFLVALTGLRHSNI
jgi:hypothetical protein